MVIVLTHEIVSAVLFYHNPEKFLTCNSLRNFEKERKIKELLQKLEQSADVADWFTLIEDAIKVQTAKPICCVVYLAEIETGQLQDVRKNPIPNQGVCWDAYQTRQIKPFKLLAQNDPITTIGKQKCTFDPKYVYCQPITDENQVISVLAILTSSKQDFKPESLKPISEKLVGCYRRLCHTRSQEQNSTSSPPVQLQTSVLKEAIIQLCGELYDQDAADLQIKVLKFLEDHTKAECAFLLLVVPETHELFCQVIRGKILEEELRFPGQSSSFALALDRRLPITLEDIPSDKRPGIENFIGCKLQSMLCVPVSSKANEKLIALACLVNKKDKESFNNDDIHIVKECFQYTSTVLTSTLAFQNERKLKIQTQAMLQVARNLFTHLGEFTLLYGKDIDNFPYIKSGLFEVNTFGLQAGNGYDRSHCRPYVPRKFGQQLNNSARLDMLFYRQIDAVIEKQDQLANQLTGMGEVRKLSPEKIPKHHQPKVKSPEKRRNRNQSPEKHYGQPYTKERRSLDVEYLEFTPLLESTRYSKPDIILETEGAEKSIDVMIIKGERDGKTIKLNLLSNDLSTEEQDFDDQTSNYSDANELPPITPTYERTVRKFFTPPRPDESVDLDVDNASYRTARSPVQSVMYSACDETENDDSENLEDVDDENMPEDIRNFYNNMKETEKQLNTSFSDTKVFDNTCNDEMTQHSHVSDNDFEKADARLSTSEPSLSNIHDQASLAPDITDSKPEFNDAFIQGSSESTLAADSDISIVRKKSAEDFVDKDVSKIKLLGRTTSVIIEDVDTHQKLTLSIQVSNADSAVYSDEDETNSTHQLPKITTGITEYMRRISVPSTENIPFETNDLTKLLREIMQEARNLTQAERCSVFLIDQEVDELVAKVFDGALANDNEVQSEIRMPITQGIAGHVATTGNLLNIKDAYAHPMFYRGIDDSTGFRTRNILCFPIKNETDNVLGVAQLCNKMNGPYFTTFDEDVASAFAVYCCISISHSLMYQKLQRSQHRNKLANELMIYHMQVASEEVQELAQSEIPPPSHWHPNFSKFNYPPREVPEDETPLCCLSMFEDLGFISRWRIKRDTLARFILMVKRGYRNPPYHNWMHAFAVAHFCYLCIKNFKLNEYMEDIELFALFVSCLCHDIDHRGTNNSYQVASKSVLAALYSSEGAVLERHHFAQTMCIVNTEGCNIYENLISKDYQHVLDLMRDIILATDLAHHLKILKNIEAMAKDKFEKNNLKHRKLLLCLIMTASDLSDQTKPWDSTKHIAALIYNEFFSQGDLEKSLGRTPPEMMDREKARIPDLQIGFLDHIALPVYRVLQDLFVEAKVVHNTVKENHRHWEKICALIKLRRGGSCEQMSYEQILALEEEANSLPEDEVKSVQQNGH
ncbi:uncharacterized protein LOC143042018 isoform X1 [Mytilus galloprovincialis]|uniref:uncharacterized protein LOC143042018 isoform X1 n=1 Tax=Mytilus galloprovincialis TaxID=29158 RepID=UPI003F7BED78